MKKKTVVLLLALVLVIGCAVGGTVAWLVDSTEAVVNTFSSSNIDITLTETDAVNNAKTFKMVPGATITKDPVVTVEAGSEACWLFVKVEESAVAVTVNETSYDFDDFISYSIASGWTVVPDAAGVYYREVGANADIDQEFEVLTGNTVTVPNTVTKDMMDGLDATKPTLTITAYAVQHEGINSVATAWAEAKALDSTP